MYIYATLLIEYQSFIAYSYFKSHYWSSSLNILSRHDSLMNLDIQFFFFQIYNRYITIDTERTLILDGALGNKMEAFRHDRTCYKREE